MAEHKKFSMADTMTRLLDEKKYRSIRDVLVTMNPSDIAVVLE